LTADMHKSNLSMLYRTVPSPTDQFQAAYNPHPPNGFTTSLLY